MSSMRVVFVCFVASVLGCFSAQIPDEVSVGSDTGAMMAMPRTSPQDSVTDAGETMGSPWWISDSGSPSLPPQTDGGSEGKAPSGPQGSRCSNPGADSSRWVELNFDGRYEGAIRDQNTGLVWTFFPATNVHGTFEFWTNQHQAETYCNNIEHAGFNDWRLPSKDELLTLVDMRYQSPASGFPCMTPSTHWSADIYEGDNQLGWYISFGTGVAAYDGGSRGTSRLFKCVR